MDYTELMESALQLIDGNNSDEAILKLIDAYNKTTDINTKETILGIVIEKFVEPNEQRLQKAYIDNINYITQKGWLVETIVPQISELNLVMIPVSEDIYYIWDNETCTFLGSKPVDLSVYRNLESRLIFDAMLIDGFTDFRDILPELIKNRYSHTYIVLDNDKLLKDFFSFMQIPKVLENIKSDISIISNRDNVFKLLNQTGNYIPRRYKMARNYNYVDIMNSIHAQRLIKPKKNRPFLSICIPTYNRGESLYHNVLKITQINYDEEIEIVIVNHGDSDEYYEKVKEIAATDSRIVYIEYKVDDFAEAMCDTFSRPSGMYALLCTDEDRILNERISYAMQYIYERQEYAVFFFKAINEKKQLTNYGDYNDESDLYLRLSQVVAATKVTGICFNVDIYKKHDVNNIINNKWKENVYYKIYPHAINVIYMAIYGNVGGGDILFVDAPDVREDYKDGKYIWHYQTLESRLEQMNALVDIIMDFDIDIIAKVNVIMAIQGKTYLLLDLAYDVHKEDMTSFHSWEECCDEVKKEIDNFWDNPNEKFILSDDSYKRVKDALQAVYDSYYTNHNY